MISSQDLKMISQLVSIFAKAEAPQLCGPFKQSMPILFPCTIVGKCLSTAVVTKVEPRRIGYGGGVVTIHGDGFSEDVFNQFDPILGNKVSIVGIFNFQSPYQV